MENLLTILESVDGFYSNAFGSLITITIAILAFSGAILPILMMVYQTRFFRIESKEIESNLEKIVSQKIDDALILLKNESEKSLQESRKSIETLETSLTKKIDAAQGASMHLTGNIQFSEKHYFHALESLSKAGSLYISCGNHRNLKRVIRMISDNVLPQVTKNLLELQPSASSSFESFLRGLSDQSINGEYGDEITKLNIEYKRAGMRASEKPSDPSLL